MCCIIFPYTHTHTYIHVYKYMSVLIRLPILLVHLPWQVDEQIHACYTQTMSEWLGCEAIVRQRERESHAAALAKCSSGASLDSHLQRMMHRDSTVSNEVIGGSPRGARWRLKAGLCFVGLLKEGQGLGVWGLSTDLTLNSSPFIS